jgi:uncharacterized protein (TIGR02001 family)
MKTNLFKVSPLVAAMGIAAAGATAPLSASAVEVEGTIGVANMYLWRGQNVGPDGGQVHGGVSASNAGFYGGFWATSEQGGHETDLYFGYGGEYKGFSYDISYWWYLYPEDANSNVPNPANVANPGTDSGDNDIADLVLSFGYGPVSFAAYLQQEAPTDPSTDVSGGTNPTPIPASAVDENNYFTLGYDWNKWNFTYGWWDNETAGNQTNGYINDEYSHIQVSYAATDQLTFAVSKASSDIGQENGGVEEDPLFYVAYDWAFDLTK